MIPLLNTAKIKAHTIHLRCRIQRLVGKKKKKTPLVMNEGKNEALLILFFFFLRNNGIRVHLCRDIRNYESYNDGLKKPIFGKASLLIKCII